MLLNNPFHNFFSNNHYEPFAYVFAYDLIQSHSTSSTHWHCHFHILKEHIIGLYTDEEKLKLIIKVEI